MNVEALVALVVAMTQVIKLKVPINPNIIAVVVAALVVAYKAVETGAAWNLSLLIVFGRVVIEAIGGFKVLQQIFLGKKG